MLQVDENRVKAKKLARGEWKAPQGMAMMSVSASVPATYTTASNVAPAVNR